MGSDPGRTEHERVQRVLRQAVHRTCPAWLRDQAEDLVQEATLRVFRVAERSGKEQGALGTSYLWRVAHSAVMDEIRRRRRVREEAADESRLETVTSTSASPQRALEIRRAIAEGLGRLNAARRSAVLLSLYGFSLEETARALGWNRKRADNMRHLGLAELRRHLEERGIEP